MSNHSKLNLTRGDTALIIRTCKKHKLLRNQAAYVLATAYLETAHTMKPVREYGGEKYLRSKRYYPHVGMGYVQITWEYNYLKASKKLGVDFVSNPKLLLKPKYAVEILVIGSKEGWFTGKKLSDYITLQKSNFVGARRIINGTNVAGVIAGLAREYDTLLLGAQYGVGKPTTTMAPVISKKNLPVPKVTQTSLFAVLSSFLLRLFLR